MKRATATAGWPTDAAVTQLPHLETFARAAELSSFTAAARLLGLTQAAVSQRIHALETSLGVAVFHRQGGTIVLTEAGKRLYDYALRILALHQEARQSITGEEPVVAGELALGASTVPGEHLLPALLAIFHQRYPGIQLKADISDSMQVIGQVERGQVQLGLVGRKSDNPQLEFHHIATDRMVLVVPQGHAWKKRKEVSLEKLCEQPLILRESGSGLRHCFEKSLAECGKSLRDLNIALELGSNEAIKEAVQRGIGLAVLSTYAVDKEVKSGQLHPLRVTGLRCDREIFLVWDRRRALSPPARVFKFFLEANPIAETP
ncbi:MAG: selenium metabolism-associated LysR family transcriptional regulator [Pirellulales bacterium]